MLSGVSTAGCARQQSIRGAVRGEADGWKPALASLSAGRVRRGQRGQCSRSRDTSASVCPECGPNFAGESGFLCFFVGLIVRSRRHQSLWSGRGNNARLGPWLECHIGGEASLRASSLQGVASLAETGSPMDAPMAEEPGSVGRLKMPHAIETEASGSPLLDSRHRERRAERLANVQEPPRPQPNLRTSYDAETLQAPC